MKKKLGFALLFAALVLCLSGCRSSYTRSEVRTYTWKLLHYSPFFTLSQESVPVVGEDSYTDQVWTVRTWGKNPLEFRVVESHGWNMEWASVGLVTDYADALILQEAEKFEGLQDITLDTSWKEGRLYTYLNAEFSTREELQFQPAGVFRPPLLSPHAALPEAGLAELLRNL